jgi:hypothetical protein
MGPGAANVTGIPAVPQTGPEGENLAFGLRSVTEANVYSSDPVELNKLVEVAVPL